MLRNQTIATLSAIALLASPAVAASRASSQERFIVGWEGAVAPSTLAAVGLEVLEARADLGLFLVRAPDGVTPGDLELALGRIAGCRFVERDQCVVADQISLAFIDQRVRNRNSQRSHLDGGGWRPDGPRGNGAPVRVALLDTGVDFLHPLLAGCLSASGQDYVDHDLQPQEEMSTADGDGDGNIGEAYGHGTHAAGMLAALTRHRVEIVPMRVLDAEGNGRLFDVVQALHDARRAGAEIHQLSLSVAADSRALREAVQAIQDAGGLVIASAGNAASRTPRYPAAFPGVLAVAAADAAGVVLATSSFGAHVSFSADGDQVLSTYPGGRRAFWTGSSMATSMVAALAAAEWHDAASTRQALAASALPIDALNPGKQGEVGLGLVREHNPYED